MGKQVTAVNDIVLLFTELVALIVAVLVSSGTIWDCRFVLITSNHDGPFAHHLDSVTDSSRFLDTIQLGSRTVGLGFFLWEGTDGNCDVQESGDSFITYLLYQEFLGSDWWIPRTMVLISLVTAFAAILCTCVFSCVSHVKAARYALALVFTIVLPTFLSIPFMIFRSDFCDTYNCTMGRSALYSVLAAVLYVATGLSLLFTSNHRTIETVADVIVDPEQQLLLKK